jgi:hypothetical protein
VCAFTRGRAAPAPQLEAIDAGSPLPAGAGSPSPRQPEPEGGAEEEGPPDDNWMLPAARCAAQQYPLFY